MDRRDRIRRSAAYVAPAAAAFTPTSLFTDGVHKGGWWSFHDLANMFQVSDGTGSVVSGDPVGQVKNKAVLTGAAHMLQATAGRRPTKHATWGVDFDPAGLQHILAVLPASITTTTLHAIMTFRINTYSSSYMRILSATLNGGADFNSAAIAAVICRNNFNSTIEGYRNGDKADAGATATATNLRCESLFDGVNHNMRIGATVATPVASSGSFGFNYLTIAAHVFDLSSLADIQVGDLIVRDLPITGSDLTDLRTYLDATL